MNRVRLSLWPAIVALPIVATLTLCGGLRAEDTQTPIEHFKAETDRVLDYLRANPNADWTDVRKHIEPIVAEIEQSDLTRDDLSELQRYMDQRGEDLKGRIAGFRKEMSAGSPLANPPRPDLQPLATAIVSAWSNSSAGLIAYLASAWAAGIAKHRWGPICAWSKPVGT